MIGYHSTNVFSLIPLLQFGHLAVSTIIKSTNPLLPVTC